MKQSFEEFLQEYVCRTEPCTDDLLPEIYADWICEVDPELIVELAEKWHKEQSKQQYLRGAKDMWEAVGLSGDRYVYEVTRKKAQQFIDSLTKENNESN